MLTTYLTIYLFFLLIATLLISFIVLRLHLPSPILVIGVLLFFIISPVMVGYFYVAYFDSLPEVTVPGVVGLTENGAKTILEEAGLRVRIAGSINEIKYPEGYVVSQRPESGRVVKNGRLINLMLSSGKRRVTTPNLIGRQLSQIGELLSAVGLEKGEVRAETQKQIPEGTILAQEPLPGEQVPNDKPVDLIISTTLEVQDQNPDEE